MDTAVHLPFADGVYRFWLPMPQVIELERKCAVDGKSKSLFLIYDEISGGLAFDGETPVYVGGGAAIARDVREVIRNALIGGGTCVVDGEQIDVGPIRATELVDTYTYPNRPLIETVHTAWRILHAAIHGISLKKKAPAAESEPTTGQPSKKAE